ncbi:MAG: hypothetical protein AAFP08_05485 [Bacteroidota bacterium]
MMQLKQDGIYIERSQLVDVFPFTEIAGLEISRGATFHYQHKKKYPLVKVGNRVKFNSKGEEYDFEFLLESQAHNREFEETLKDLRKLGVRYFYRSI